MRRITHIALMLLITSCGFKPMMAKNTEGYQIVEKIQLSQVDGPEQPRLYRIISESMGDKLGTAPIYHLKINVNNEVSSMGVMKDNLSTRYRVKVTFNYTLVKIETQEPIDSGNIYLYSSYDVADSEFANYIAERYTNDNILKELCEELKSRLVLVLSSRN